MRSRSKEENPFVGLRPFESEDSLYYFGRNEQTRALLRQLHANRFLAVVGASGSGKSSLVRAGLIPILEGGFLVQDRDTWQFATMKPGASPLANLAESLLAVHGETVEEGAIEGFRDGIRGGGVAAILEEIRPVLDSSQTNLLLVVDQFEELFRFASNLDEREEAADFVNLLLRLAEQSEIEIYVVLTMRSDFIGDCDRFRGLPEAMNRSQYLVPRLTRQQRREAIAGPIRLSRAKTAPRLLDKLLNESLDTRDDLPILQHALMRTWDNWAASGADGPIDLEHYEAVGGVAEALNNHADEAFAELDLDDHMVARRLFEALTETDSGNRQIRRPAHLSEIAAITNAPPARIEHVIDTFREAGRSFLVRTRKPGRDDFLIDISHESLIRQWDRLHHWVEEEAEAASTYRRLAETAELHGRGRADVYRGIDLEAALERQAEYQPTKAWCLRYHPGFEAAQTFLAKSQQAHENELASAQRIRKQRQRTRFIITSTVILVLSAIALFAWKQRNFALEQKSFALEQKREAQGLRLTTYADYARAAESTTTAELERLDLGGFASGSYQQIWLSTLGFLSKGNLQNLPKTVSSPLSLGRLTRWDLAAGAMSNLWTSPRNVSPLSCAIFNPGGNYFVSGSQNGTLALWHYPSTDSAPLKVAASPFTDVPTAAMAKSVHAMAFSPDGRILANSSGKMIRIWDFSDPTMPRKLDTLNAAEGNGSSEVRGLAFSPDGQILAAAAGGNNILLWDFSDPQSPRPLDCPWAHDGPVYSIAFSRDGKLLASGSGDKSVRLWDLSLPSSSDPTAILAGHKDSVATLAFHPTLRILASGGRDASLQLWDLSNPAEPVELARIEDSHADAVSQVAFSPDGSTLASSSYDNSIGIWDISNPSAPGRRSHFQDHLDHAYTVAFGTDGSSLLSASEDHTVRLWDLTDPRTLQKSSGHSDYVNSIAISPDGEILASGSRDNTTRLWTLPPNGDAPRELSVLREHNDFIYTVAISPDGKLLASGSRDTDIHLFNLDDPAAPELLASMGGDPAGITGHSSWVLSLAFSSDSKTLVSGSEDNSLRVWNLTNPREPRQEAPIKDFKGWVSTVAFSPKGKTLAAGCYDGTIQLYDLSNPGQPQKLSSPPNTGTKISCLAFSPMGDLLGSGALDGTIHLWDLDDLSSPIETEHSMNQERGIVSIAFDHNGKTLASASADRTIRLWDLAEPKSPNKLAVLSGHTKSVSSVVFSSDGGTLYSGSRDNSIRMWKLSGPFDDYRREGYSAASFQSIYNTSLELLPFRLEGMSLIPKDRPTALPQALRYRPPGKHPIKWILDRAAK